LHLSADRRPGLAEDHRARNLRIDDRCVGGDALDHRPAQAAPWPGESQRGPRRPGRRPPPGPVEQAVGKDDLVGQPDRRSLVRSVELPGEHHFFCLVTAGPNAGSRAPTPGTAPRRGARRRRCAPRRPGSVGRRHTPGRTLRPRRRPFTAATTGQRVREQAGESRDQQGNEPLEVVGAAVEHLLQVHAGAEDTAVAVRTTARASDSSTASRAPMNSPRSSTSRACTLPWSSRMTATGPWRSTSITRSARRRHTVRLQRAGAGRETDPVGRRSSAAWSNSKTGGPAGPGTQPDPGRDATASTSESRARTSKGLG